MISFHCWIFQPKKFTILLTLLTHSTLATNIKFTCEIKPSECTVFLDTEVFKGPHLSAHKILDLQTHLKPTETFQYRHFSSCHPSNCKKGKGEALHVQHFIFCFSHFESHPKTVNIQGYSGLQETIRTHENCYPLIWLSL